MTDAWDFFQHQILGMEWLNDLVGKGLSGVGVDVGSRLGGSVQFFIYDTVKILILLTVLIFIISYVQSYFPPERSKKIMGKFKGISGKIIGAFLGTVTPFCSCSSIPIFVGFNKAGVPLGTSISFLISSPFVDIAALIILMSIFGPEIAVAYVILGVILAVIGGVIMDTMHMESQIKDFARPSCCSCGCGGVISIDEGTMSVRDRAEYSVEQVKETVGKVWKYVLIGVLIGALIHNWIPEEIIQTVLGEENPFSVLIATLIGVPIYADIFGTIPIAEALFDKGVGVGTILAFMMGVTALSLPSIMMLKSVMKTKLLAAFFLIVVAGIIVMGYAFNFIQLL